MPSGLRHLQPHLPNRVLLDQLIDALQQLVHPDAFGRRNMHHVAESIRLSRLRLRQQVKLVHYVQPRLVLDFELAQHVFHLRLLLVRSGTGDVGDLQ